MPPESDHARHARSLGDFRADRRILVLAAMALAVGSGGVFAAWALVKLIAIVSNLVWFGRLGGVAIPLSHAPRTPWMVAAPVLGGLAIGLMARLGSEKIRGHGIPEAIEAILVGESRLSPKVALLKPLSSAISIGTGGPFGAEGPIIMTGGAIGSLFAQCFHLSAAERKSLLVAGAAAGMTGIFGTPAAAVLLAVELLLFEWRPRSFIPVAAAVMASCMWRPWLFGAGPLFPAPHAPALPWWGLGLCAALGVLAGLQSTLLTKCLYALEDRFERLPIHWMWWPAVGGLAVGLGGLIEPRALGVGYDVISDLLNDRLLTSAVSGLLLVKAGIWLLALSSGTSGGVLAPLLILGGAMGSLAGHLLPGAPGFWALLGMAAMLGGTMRAPLTGAVFGLELTGDLEALTPLLVASVAAYAVTVLMLKRSILTEKIARRGGHVTREYAIDPFELMRVSEVMVAEVDTVPADCTLSEAAAILQQGRHRTYPTVDARGRLAGLVSRADALRWLTEGVDLAQTVGERCSDPDLAVTFPDEAVARATDRMIAADQGRLPVVDRVSGALVGLLTRRDILQVRAAVSRSETERQVFFAPSGSPRAA
jgi:H+/Cl- antiporter ClcA/CBS domain-containing protein